MAEKEEPRIESAAPQTPSNAGWFAPVDDFVTNLRSMSIRSFRDAVETPTPSVLSTSRRRADESGESTDVITPKVQKLEARLEYVEQVANKVEQEKNKKVERNSLTSEEGQLAGIHLLFEEETPTEDGSGQQKTSSSEEKAAEPSAMKKACTPVWSGPVAPYEDDTIWSWVNNFFGGVSTAHGINRAFDDDNGLVRRIFWVFLFLASLVILYLQLESSIADYFSAATTTNIDTQEGSNVMPMMTVCNQSPIRCGCEGFYDAEIRENDEYLARVVPFLCGEVLGYNEAFTGQVDGDGKRIDFQIMETARDRLDLTKTRNKMREFTSTLTCDNGPYTKAWFVEAVKAGKVTTQELMNYAGYHDRGRLVRFCQSKDEETGEKISCMDDRFWSPPQFDDNYGACHTLNPCYEFPVGKSCESDADCESTLGPRVPGGVCGASQTCECTLCQAGSDCKVISQLKAGRGEGIRMVVNTAVDQDAEITSAEKARWSSGAIVHFHSYLNDRSFGGAITASPGRITELILGQAVYDKVKRFPWTQCYEKSITDSNQCVQACLHRTQAMECCNVSSGHLADGRFPAMKAVDPSGAEEDLHSPTLLCNILDPALEGCLNRQTQRLAEGTICIDGAATDRSSAYWGLLKRVGWYDPGADRDDDEIPDQEEDQWEIKTQCVWPEVKRKLPDGSEESRHGMSCDGDSSRCESDTGEADRQGECVVAHRAYCPGRCEALSFEVVAQGSSLLSNNAAQIMANDELAWVSFQAAADPNRQRRWQPRCGRDANGTYVNTDTCFTTAEAMALVRDNYAMITVDFENFDKQIITIEDKIPTEVLLGTVGGNLGMWVGMSVMTILECIELAIFALLAIPFFFFGKKLPFIKKREQPPPPDDAGAHLNDVDLQRVLSNLKKLAKRRKAGLPLSPTQTRRSDEPSGGATALQPRDASSAEGSSSGTQQAAFMVF